MSALTESLAPKKLRPWHVELADIIIANPTLKQGDWARMMGKTQAWISIVTNGDAFKSYLKTRREEIIDPILSAAVEDRFAAVAEKATEEFLRRLELAPSSVSNKHLIDAMGTAASAIGLGPKAPAPPQTNLYIVPAPPQLNAAQWQQAGHAHLESEARARLEAVERVDSQEK